MLTKAFWKKIGIIISVNQDKFIRNFNQEKYVKKLTRSGVTLTDINYIMKKFNSLTTNSDIIEFYRISEFYLKSPSTAQKFFKSKTRPATYRKLINTYCGLSLEDVKTVLFNLSLVYRWEIKGRGSIFYAKKISKRIAIKNIKARDITYHLNRHEDATTYRTFKSFIYNKYRVIPFKRERDEFETYKFIAIKELKKRLEIFITYDSDKEIQIIKNSLSLRIKTFLEIPELRADFSRLLKFIISGASTNFMLIGIKLRKDDYTVTAFPTTRKHQSISQLDFFKRFGDNINEENVLEMLIQHKSIEGKNTFRIEINSILNGNLLGALYIRFVDSKLDDNEIKIIEKDFKADFGVQLRRFIISKKLSNQDICRIYLHNPNNKVRKKIDLHIPEAFTIYNSIKRYGLLPRNKEKSDNKGYCFNSRCRRRHEIQWHRAYCENCQSLLFPGKTVIIPRIDQPQIINFLKQYFAEQNIPYQVFPKYILSKKHLLIQITLNGEQVQFLPLSRKLSDNEIEIISFRFPALIILDTKGQFDASHDSRAITTIDLYKFYFEIIIKNNGNYLISILRTLNSKKIERIRSMGYLASNRITNYHFYKGKNNVYPNYGAELFEADCSAILNYIFSNSIWLGTAQRGQKVPDGISSLPLRTRQRDGCIMWDAKFAESARVTIGSASKYAHYVKDGKANKTIKSNGGLKAFIFIGNKCPPKCFNRNFKKVAKARRNLKFNFMSNHQLHQIFEFYKKNEPHINSSDQIRIIFFTMIKEVLFKKKNKKTVVEIIENIKLSKLLRETQNSIKKNCPQAVRIVKSRRKRTK